MGWGGGLVKRPLEHLQRYWDAQSKKQLKLSDFQPKNSILGNPFNQRHIPCSQLLQVFSGSIDYTHRLIVASKCTRAIRCTVSQRCVVVALSGIATTIKISIKSTAVSTLVKIKTQFCIDICKVTWLPAGTKTEGQITLGG